MDDKTYIIHCPDDSTKLSQDQIDGIARALRASRVIIEDHQHSSASGITTTWSYHFIVTQKKGGGKK